MAGVASDVYERMVVRGTVKGEDIRIIYQSPVFPTSSFAYAHDLKPELAAKMVKCFYDFRFPPAMQKEFNGDDRFFPITYKDNWKVGPRDRGKLRHALQQGGLRQGNPARGGSRRQKGRGGSRQESSEQPQAQPPKQ